MGLGNRAQWFGKISAPPVIGATQLFDHKVATIAHPARTST